MCMYMYGYECVKESVEKRIVNKGKEAAVYLPIQTQMNE